MNLQAGSNNAAGVTIIGSGNNMPVLASFSGAALGASTSPGTSVTALVPDNIEDVIDTIPLVNDLYDDISSASALQPGLMTQIGAGNQLTVTVTGNSNLFATLQNGGSNSITHTVGNSDVSASNQAAIVQIGSSNTSSTTQNGSNNNVGVVQ